MRLAFYEERMFRAVNVCISYNLCSRHECSLRYMIYKQEVPTGLGAVENVEANSLISVEYTDLMCELSCLHHVQNKATASTVVFLFQGQRHLPRGGNMFVEKT
jgi:hypothetical protein